MEQSCPLFFLRLLTCFKQREERSIMFINGTGKLVSAMALISLLCLQSAGHAQERDRNRDSAQPTTRIEPGTLMAVRTNNSIDVERGDNRVYAGIVDQDVPGDNGRLAIPRGSRAG